VAIISDDYDGASIYYFSDHEQSLILKRDVDYSYTGGAWAFEVDVNFARFLVAGTIYSRGVGMWCIAAGPTIDIAATGSIFASGTALQFSGTLGSIEVNNYGIVSGEAAIYAEDTTGYAKINNFGTLTATFRGGYAVRTGDASDTIVNLGTMNGYIQTGDGNDTIDTRLGVLNGVIFGGAGDDIYIIAGQTINEMANGSDDDGGDDTVFSYTDYALPQHVESLFLQGTATVGRGNAEDNRIGATELGGRLYGSGGDDQLSGGDGDDVLHGGGGDDAATTGGGDDRVFGGTGDDFVTVAADTVTFDGGSGNDTIAFLSNDTAIVADLTLASGIVTGGKAGESVLTNVEGVWGTEFVDTITGNALANNLLGYLGDDTLSGLAGDDTIEGYTGADTLDGGDGIDTLSYANAAAAVTVNLLTKVASGGDAQGDTFANFENLRGGYGNDTLTGSAAANMLEGGAGDDLLNGDRGTDRLVGGFGKDTLTGGLNGDVFAFGDVNPKADEPIPSGFGNDTITDFVDKVDRVSFESNSLVHSMSDLTVAQVGANTVVTVTDSGDSITLLNFSAVKFTSADVIFGPDVILG
jgi:Ca2+-binding RTX toxin-like protein